MNRAPLLISCVLSTLMLVHCSADDPGRTPTEPGHGALEIAVVPNPIVATRVSGDTYDFPFDVRVTNPGSLPVSIERVQIDVTAFGGLKIHSESKNAADIREYGYPTTLAPGETLSYHFEPREDVPDDRLFDGVSALLTAVGADSSGKEVSASIRVSVTR